MSGQKRTWRKTRHIELKCFWLQEDENGKSENETSPRRANFAGPLDEGESWCEIDELLRGVGGQMTASISNKGNEHRWKKWQER